MQEQSDEILIRQYLSGDEESLEILIGRYLKPLYNFVLRYLWSTAEAEDITQEVFLRAWRNIKKFDQTKKFKTWLFSIAKNASVDFLRSKRAIPFSEMDGLEGESALDNLPDPAPLPPEILERADLADILRLAMGNLTPPHRMVLFLHYNDHFSFREIAESTGEPLHTVKSRHRRALLKLREILEKQ